MLTADRVKHLRRQIEESRKRLEDGRCWVDQVWLEDILRLVEWRMAPHSEKETVLRNLDTLRDQIAVTGQDSQTCTVSKSSLKALMAWVKTEIAGRKDGSDE